MTRITLLTKSPEATQAIGRQLGASLLRGHVIALVGPLGSGKTTLVKGIADGAGVCDPRQVNSPTFVIVNEYEAGPGGQGLRIHHVDAYRLRGGSDLEALGFDEMVSDGAVVVEWADRVAAILPTDLLEIQLEPVGESDRQLILTAAGPISQQLLARLSPPA